MLIVVDAKIPDSAKESLKNWGEVFELKSTGIVYPEISGHPDIFMCQSSDNLIVAPNAPEELFYTLKKYQINFKVGEKQLGMKYPATAFYNAVSTEEIFIHNSYISDSALLSSAKNKMNILVKQGYCRCNLLALKNNRFITSDSGIANSLEKQRIEVFYISPKQVLLPGFSHGFFGGTVGVFDDQIFIIGSLKYLEEGREIKKFIESQSYKIIELYDGPLFDGGGIFFFDI